jgi:hypothetical protein
MYPYFRLTRSAGLGAVLISAALTPFSAPASADGPFDDLLESQQYCTKYSKDAAKAAQTNAKYGCYPQSDPRWDTRSDKQYHYCMGQSDLSYLEEEKSSRKLAADNCTYCNSDEAAIASGNRVLDNKLYNCGFTGPQWSDDPHERLKACVGTPQGGPGIPPRGGLYGVLFPAPRAPLAGGSAKEFESEWQKQIDQCKAKYNEPLMENFCQDYATQAYQLANYYPQNIMAACTAGQEPYRWSRDYQSHFQWCMNASNRPLLADEQNARMTTIRQCASKFGFDPPSPSDSAFKPVGPTDGFFRSKTVLFPGIPGGEQSGGPDKIYPPGSPNAQVPKIPMPGPSSTPSPVAKLRPAAPTIPSPRLTSVPPARVPLPGTTTPLNVRSYRPTSRPPVVKSIQVRRASSRAAISRSTPRVHRSSGRRR